MAEEVNPELESFRKQWQEEVTARSKGSSSRWDKNLGKPLGPPKRENSNTESQPLPHPGVSNDENEAYGGVGSQRYYDLEDKDEARKRGEEGGRIHPSTYASHVPSSALEHYEKAVEKESEGNLGDSLKLYRKAYRLDSGVDKFYRTKHFPPSSSKSKIPGPNPSNAPVTVPNPAHHSLDGPLQPLVPELITSFSSLSISAAPALTDQSPLPLCPISTIPSELLIEILERTAIADVASFARLSLVCKCFAYLVATEDQIWRRVCLGIEHGFGAMHYNWKCSISGDPLPYLEDNSFPPIDELPSSASSPSPSPLALTFALTPAYPNYKTMFHHRPRLRFGGCYISTVNYIRPGASTPSQVSWNTPVHVVTYYRYLRFFRDGACISLLTTTEPADVVHHLRKEHLHTHHAGGLPSAVMNHALRGRWKLSGPDTSSSTSTTTKSATITTTTSSSIPATSSPPSFAPVAVEPEGTVDIETQGVDADKYVYKMQFALRSAGRGPGAVKNNKLAWRGFWSWNKLTDDWAEFGLRNDRAFFWSRVGSYGGGWE